MSDETQEPDNFDEVAKVLGEPILPDYSDNTLRIRRNLLIVSVISIAYGWGDLKIAPDSTLFGVKFDNVDPVAINWLIFCLLAYHVVHFAWNSVTHLQEWRIRLTGTKLTFITGAKYGSADGDYPDDPRQSSLYGWWVNQAHQIGNIKTPLLQIESDLKRYYEEILRLVKEAEPENRSLHNEIVGKSGTLVDVHGKISQLRQKVEAAEKTITSKRVPESLRRFDVWFKLFEINNLTRWFVIEFTFPIVLGLVGLWFMGMTLASNC
ncbi:hypothetical protein RJ527_18870 [Thalassospiraceae bacterium LMO-SO8]|nr:hypothetical protein [Alphaproteobacteria bacterium LMO-S08]WND76069.1 hypothetical protein RJ527_18870 [Thalassospiraceae bacterium LMO-SO8]